MTYVPIPIVPPTPPSPRTRELADLLARVIEEYEKHHPAVSGAEVREALSLASQSSKTTAPAARSLVAMLLLGLMALGAALFYFVERGGGGGTIEFPMIAVVTGVILVLGLVAVLKGRRNL